MLPKQNRLQKDKEIAQVFRKGQNYFSDHLVFKSKPNSKGDTRFTFIVSKKISKKATRRNSLRRQLRAVVSRLLFIIKTGYDVIVLVKRDFDFPYDQAKIHSELKYILKRANLVNSEKDIDQNNRNIPKNPVA